MVAFHPIAIVLSYERIIDMDFIKDRIKIIPAKATQPKVSDKPMEDNFICVFRERDLLANQVNHPPEKSNFRILLNFFKTGV